MKVVLVGVTLLLAACGGGGGGLVDRSEGGGQVVGFITAVDTEEIMIESASGDDSETFEFGADESIIPHLRDGHQEIREPVLVRWTVRDGELVATAVDDVPAGSPTPEG